MNNAFSVYLPVNALSRTPLPLFFTNYGNGLSCLISYRDGNGIGMGAGLRILIRRLGNC
jgi:hypothetical protein